MEGLTLYFGVDYGNDLHDYGCCKDFFEVKEPQRGFMGLLSQPVKQRKRTAIWLLAKFKHECSMRLYVYALIFSTNGLLSMFLEGTYY